MSQGVDPQLAAFVGVAAVYRRLGDDSDLTLARRAYGYLALGHFWDADEAASLVDDQVGPWTSRRRLWIGLLDLRVSFMSDG